MSKPAAGVFKKVNVAPMQVVREVRLEKTEKLQGYEVGQALTVEMFAPGELVDVVGVTKGKGFQGGVRRYGWYGGDATHGSMFHRAPGSIGASSDPSRVWPGHHMPGRMGGDRRTVLNLARGARDGRAKSRAGARRGARRQWNARDAAEVRSRRPRRSSKRSRKRNSDADRTGAGREGEGHAARSS